PWAAGASSNRIDNRRACVTGGRGEAGERNRSSLMARLRFRGRRTAVVHCPSVHEGPNRCAKPCCCCPPSPPSLPPAAPASPHRPTTPPPPQLPPPRPP